MFYSYERIIIMEMGQMKNNIEALFKEEEGTEEVRERKREREERGAGKNMEKEENIKEKRQRIRVNLEL